MNRLKTLTLLAGLAILAACSNGTGITLTDTLSADAVGGDVGPDAVIFPDAEGDTPLPDGMVEDTVDTMDPDGIAPPCKPGDGCFLDPCAENGDCLYGYCVMHLGESVCSQPCQEECPDGWSCQQVAGTEPDVEFICVSNFANLCRPCDASTECTSTGAEDVCVTYGSDVGSFCGGECGANMPCPEGYTCEDVTTTEGVETSQCVNDLGECTCTETSILLGLGTTCEVTNETGTCQDDRICTEDGLTPCEADEPSEDICDGLDNDCDGDTDTDPCDDENDCTADECLGEDGCDHVALDGDSCSDGDLCTEGDACEAGVCLSAPKDCDDENTCTDDSCDPETGDCINAANTDFCNDEDPCTTDDLCDEGICAGTAIDCDCAEDADCVALEDGDLCNGTLICNTDILPHKCEVEEATIIECPKPEEGPNTLCLQPTCEAETGDCGFGPDNDNMPCADGDACTIGEICAAGVCGGGQDANCNDGNPCTDDGCDPIEGCQNTPNTEDCEDGDGCTLNDQCDEGECKGGDPLDCDDDNPCTADQCETGEGCLHTPTDGECTDNNPCTLGDYCSGGACLSTGIDTCDDDNPCTDDSCNPALGCEHTTNNNLCDDGDACTTADQCKNGSCSGVDTDCDDDNVCTDDYCIPPQGCVYLNNYNDCTDGNECTDGDQCSEGVCEGQAKNCDDGNLCTNDSCDPTSGCFFDPNDVPCDDEDTCTLGDTCKNSACVGGSSMDCDDGNPCTDDSCDPALGCQHENNTAGCDDNNTCTTGDACSDGVCMGSGSLECDDDNPCTKDICLPGGGCDHENVDGACSDDDPCTVNDACVDGACVSGGPKDCDDANPCTDDSCDTDGVCQNVPNAADCDDGNACTTGDYCDTGVCSSTDTLGCDDNNVCTTDSCDPTTGCLNDFNTNPCDDLDACSTGDVCLDGVCESAGTLDCDDGNICTDNSCDPNVGCVTEFNLAPCEDANECTTNVCQDGACSTTAILECGGTCGECTDFPNSYCNEGFCACEADTCDDLGVVCGAWDDGCGGTLSCGSCTDLPNSFCDEGACGCAPDTCESLSMKCGPASDGCDGALECGTCGEFEVCDPTGMCVPGGTGDTCTTPFTVTGVPFSASGATDGAADDYGYSTGACAPEEGGFGVDAPDVAYEFVPTAHGLYRIILTGDYDSNLYLVTDCDDVDASCVAGDEEACVGCDEEIVVELDANEIYYIIVDGWAGASAAGDYTLTIDEVGDTCDDPVPVGALPFTWDGDTIGATPDYGYSTGMCPPEPGGYGAGAPDETYEFTPDQTGFYAIALTAEYDSNLYVVTDCADVDGTCVAGDEDICSDCTEDVTPFLTAGTTYYIIVDGWSNSSATNGGAYTLNISVDCIPSCAGVECGDDGCGGSCGTCTALPNSFCDAGTCSCAADDCTDLGYTCGDWDDGCDGIAECGTCTDFVNSFCDAGTCGCTADTCATLGAECGVQDDNCGSTVDCGGCVGTDSCVVDECRPEGDTCANPLTVGALPFVGTGDTTVATPDYGYSAGQCPPVTGGWRMGANDEVWEFTPAVTTTYFLELDGSFDSNLYIVTDCADVGGTCVAGDEDVGSSNPEELLVELTAATTYYIIVDGYGTTTSQHGPYTLTVEPVGDTCKSAHPVNSMPFTFDGDTSDATGQYGYSAGMCPPETGGWGSAAKDEAFTFTPGISATYEIILDASFDSNLYIITDCTDVDGSCVAGDEDDGDLEAEELTLDLTAGTTYYIIVDGFGTATSQDGPFTLTIEDVTCVPETCGTLGHTCGSWDDGCGGTLDCGTCGVGEECFSGECLMIGDTCANPIVVDALPYSAAGDTTGATDDYGYSAGMCPPETGGYGASAPDLAYEFTPTYTNDYAVTLTGTNFDSNLYVVSDCSDIDGSCLAGDEDICSNCTEDVTVALTAGETYYVIVDGFAGAANDGPYTLTIDCVPDTCAELGYECGSWDDGCGGTVACAACAGGDTCAAGTCLPDGDTCDNPFTVGAVPFSATGDTTGYGADYGYSAGSCPGESVAYGAGAPDQVYEFTPEVTTDYLIQLTGTGFDSNLYVITDCDDVNGSCLGADEDICSNCTESLEMTLTAGTTYYIIVDGFSTSSYTNDGPYTLTIEIVGDTCNAPFTVGALPFSFAGSTTDATNQYWYSYGQCPPETGGYGAGAYDEVFEFVPTQTATYDLELTHDYDGNLYIITDCSDVDGSCVAGDEDVGISNAEELTVALTAGTTYYIIVDGWSNSSSNAGNYTLTVDLACDGWLWNGACWYTGLQGESCNQTCATHCGFDVTGSQHVGNDVGMHFWPAKTDGGNWVEIECSSTDNNTNWGANGGVPDGDWSHTYCHPNCACNC